MSFLSAAWLYAGPAHDAVKKLDIAALRSLLQTNATSATSTTEDGVTPVHVAAALDKPDMIELLVAAGADVNAKTTQGTTALHWAAMANAAGAAELLIRKGADVGITTPEGLTALQIATKKGSAKVGALLAAAETGVRAGILADKRFVEGRQALEKKEAQKAFDIFMELLRERPESMEVNYSVGEAAYAAGKYSHAALAFERVIASQPDNKRARLDLARTYFSAKQLDAARREFETVLASNPPPPVRKNIQDFLNDIRRQEKRFWISGRVDSGVYYDDNANVGPDSDVITIAPIIVGSGPITSLNVGDTSKPKKSAGVLLCGTVSTCYDIGDKGGWMMVCDGIAYKSWLEKHATDEETSLLSLNPGLIWSGTKSVLRLPAKVSYIGHGGEGLVSIYGIAPSVSFVLGQGTTWNCTLETAAEFRDYVELDDRDGTYFAVGARIGHSLAKLPCSLYGGAAVFYEKTSADIYENVGGEASASGDLRLPLKVTGYAQARYRLSSYAGQEQLAPEKRRDNQYQFTVGLRRALTRSCGIDLNYQHTTNDSTFDLYDYVRNVTTLSMSYSF